MARCATRLRIRAPKVLIAPGQVDGRKTAVYVGQQRVGDMHIRQLQIIPDGASWFEESINNQQLDSGVRVSQLRAAAFALQFPPPACES